MARLWLVPLLFCVLSSAVRAEILRALPVDPSEIPAESVRPPAPEAAPLTGDEVKLPDPKRNPNSDSPEIANLPKGEDAVRLQVFLDQACFGPGVIDGMPGRFTVLAINAWNEVNGFPQDDIGPVMMAARKAVPHPFAVAIVPDQAADWVNPELSYKRVEQAGAKRMSYRGYAEFMSERYHTDVDFLIELNGASKVDGAVPRASLIVPNVKPFLIENLNGSGYGREELLSARHAVVDTNLNQVRIFEPAPTALLVSDPDGPVQVQANRALVASFPITPGEVRFIKYGQWELKNCVQLPTWRFDPLLLETGKRGTEGLDIPAGPNSPVGVLWAGLSVSGIGMHGTSDPETIGRARSHGCIRLANWDAVRLPHFIRPGATVEIR